MNPIVIMAMQGRQSLVEINLRLLCRQQCQIVVVASLADDFLFLRSLNIPQLQIVPCSNYPLGAKWQTEVNQCREANPLITLGSDDFLSHNFIENACLLAQKHEFIYLTRWYIFDQINKKSYFLRYKNLFPLGGGRVFSRQFLDKKHWRLFDVSVNVHLDDHVFNNLNADDSFLINPDGMDILSVKGNHETMNSLEKILKADSISWQHHENIDEVFNFERPIKEMF